MKVIIGSDHAGFELKEFVIKSLNKVEWIDKGTYTADSADYADFAHAVANATASAEGDFGLLICGSANGVAITANKHRDVRCAIAWNKEVAALARLHNNANILALPARFISKSEALEMIDVFLNESFEGGRHQRRIDKIPCS